MRLFHRHSLIPREYPLLLAPLLILLAALWFPIPKRVDPAELYSPLFFRPTSAEILTACPDSVTILPAFGSPALERVSWRGSELGAESAAPLEFSDRVIARLLHAESHEPDVWYRDDYRIARVTLGLARQGSPIPHVEAAFQILGCHPEQVFARITARRHALLAADYSKFFGEASSPKKPVRSVSLDEARRKRAA